MVSFKNVTKVFGSIAALREVSFEAENGEFVFITGPSGSGKTTVLRLLLRDVLPSIGHIVVGGKDIGQLKAHDVPLYRRNVGMVFQDFKLLMDRTVGENIALALAVADVPPEKRDQQVKEVLIKVGLEGKTNTFPLQLAGGELQRVVIARAIVGNPKLLLADEPTGNLDPDTAWGIIQLLEKIRQGGATIIMATHNREIVDRMHQHVVELGGGKVMRDKRQAKYKDG